MFGFFFCEGPVTCFADATKSDTEKFAKWHRMMLQKVGLCLHLEYGPVWPRKHQKTNNQLSRN